MPVYLCFGCVHKCVYRGQKKALDAVEMELIVMILIMEIMIMSLLSVGNQTWNVCKSCALNC